MNKDISINKYTTNSEFSLPYLVIKCYDFDPKNNRMAVPATIIVNDVYFKALIIEDQIKETVIRPYPNSKLDIKILYIGKKTIEVNNFRLMPKDSIVLDVFMADSEEVLY